MTFPDDFHISDVWPHPKPTDVTPDELSHYYGTHNSTYEVLWLTNFLIFGDSPLFPRPLSVSGHIVRGPQYRCDCRFRWGDPIRYFCYTLSGAGGITDASGSYRVVAGEAFLIETDNPLASYYYPSDATDPWHFLAFAFHGLQAHVTVRALLRQYGPVYRLALESATIQRLLAYEGPQVSPGQAQVAQLQLFEGVEFVTDFLMALMASRQSSEAPDPSQALVRHAVSMISEDAAGSLRVMDVARRLGVSREHLSRLCHDRLGKSLRTLMLEQRVSRACRLLKETDIPIKTIAEMLGYTAYPNFLHAFKEVMRTTPYNFRLHGTPGAFVSYRPARQGDDQEAKE